jgi:uncharacterized protein (DUF697 family)
VATDGIVAAMIGRIVGRESRTMRRKLLVISALVAGSLVAFSAPARAGEEVRTLEQATKRAAASGKLLLVDASADW